MGNCSGALDVKLCFISIDLKLTVNVDVMLDSYRNRCVVLMALNLLLLLNPCLILYVLSVYYLFYFRRCSSELKSSENLDQNNTGQVLLYFL